MRRTVMVIDDSPIVRMLMRGALEDAGFSVVEAADGDDALQQLRGSLAAIVCDLDMPRMDGITFIHHLRQHPQHGHTPVLVLTTEMRPHMREAARAGGAQAYLNKPCLPDDLVGAVNRLCH